MAECSKNFMDEYVFGLGRIVAAMAEALDRNGDLTPDLQEAISQAMASMERVAMSYPAPGNKDALDTLNRLMP